MKRKLQGLDLNYNLKNKKVQFKDIKGTMFCFLDTI